MSAITRRFPPPSNKSFGDIDVKLLGAYRWFDNLGTSISRGLPYDTTDYDYTIPGL